LLWDSFNPRSPARGSDLDHRAEQGPAGVSIHAPPRGGATDQSQRILTELQFQSTLPRAGERRTRRDVQEIRHRFNPRSPARGSDLALSDGLVVGLVSIHAPPRGGATALREAREYIAVFQSTLPRAGERLRGWLLLSGGICFNPRSPARGRDGSPG